MPLTDAGGGMRASVQRNDAHFTAVLGLNGDRVAALHDEQSAVITAGNDGRSAVFGDASNAHA